VSESANDDRQVHARLGSRDLDGGHRTVVGASAANFTVRPPVVSLPKGGGALRGIGEKFASNPVTGAGTMTVPVATSPGRSGFGPKLELSYDSSTGNGPFGLGWQLSVSSITRRTDKKLPQYNNREDPDTFVLAGSEDLVETLSDQGGAWLPAAIPDRTIDGVVFAISRFRPRIEGAFTRIERWTRGSDGDVHWRTISRDNVTTLYGKDSHSRIANPDDPRQVFSWLACESQDDKGNAIVYEYKPEDASKLD